MLINFHADEIQGKDILLLQTTLEPPLPKVLYEQMMSRLEANLKASPYLGRKIMPAEVGKSSETDIELKNDYLFYSATLSETGMSDPEISYRLGKKLNISLLTTIQLYYIPCSVCKKGDTLWMTGQLVEAETGKHLFRLNLRTSVGSDPDSVAEEAEALIGEYLENLDQLLEPKWHRLRFNGLRPSPA